MKINRANSRTFILPSILATILYVLALIPARAQVIFQLDPASKISIEGSSTLHDWSSDVTSFSGQAVMNLDKKGLEGFNKLDLSFPVVSIKGDRSGMDSKTYEALKNDKFPTIKFSLDKTENIEGNAVNVSGQLTIAGVTKNITLTATYKELPGNKVAFTGEKSFKMSDFDVTPPTALMGAIKSGDEIKIVFEVVFVTNSNLVLK